MPLFKLEENRMLPIKSVAFTKEKDIQEITENNIEAIFGLQFVSTEFAVDKFRIDTVAFDCETHSFILIEYKKSQNFSVIDQGYAYLSLMLNRKADFVLKYNEVFGKSDNKQSFDWSQSRVIFVSPSFTDFQIQAIDFKDLPIELWEVKAYENNIVRYDPIKSQVASQALISTVSKPSKTVNSVNKEIQVFTEEYLLQNLSQDITDAYYSIKEMIYEINNDVEERIKKTMNCFYADGKGLIWVAPLKNKIVLYLRKGDYVDKSGVRIPPGWGGYPETRLSSDELDLFYIRKLIEKANSY
ncbi:MAG: hypothetical protein ACYSWW_25780 [Planctomycetota bacterium]|jgi:hypothetical protein